MPVSIKPIKELLVTWGISLALFLLLSLFVGWGPLDGLGLYLALFSWWGWPLRATLELAESLFVLLALVIPVITALAIRLALERVLKDFWANLYISATAYYIVGTIYYLTAPYPRPDVDVAISLLVWIPLLLISCSISRRISQP
jgi:hypothetical protein